jgi:hypothetical protein
MLLSALTKNKKIIIILSLLFTTVLITASVTYFSVKIKQSTTFSPLPTPAPSGWKSTHSKDYNISFIYPEWMTKRFEGENPPSWILYNKNKERLIDITLTSLSIDNARKNYPNTFFKPFTYGTISGWKGIFSNSDQSVNRSLYIFKQEDNNIWLLVDLSNFNNNNQAEKTIKKIIQSITNYEK